MSFDTSSCDTPSRRHAALLTPALVLVLLGGLSSVACGHKKSPTPPPSKVPQRATLAAHQRGSEIVLEFPFPTTTISGTPLPGVSRLEVWRFEMEVPEFAVELLTEETARRKEAQDLLDELGLELYEISPIAPTEGGGLDPFAVGVPPEGTMPPTAEAPPAMADVTPQTPEPAEEPLPAGESATTQPEIEDDAGNEVGEEPAAGGADDEGGEPAADEAAVDEAAADEAGADESAAGDDAEGTEPELTEEEQLALRVEAARNLLRSPATPKSSFIAATAKDFKQGSELVLTVESADITGVVVGDSIVLRLALPPKPVEGPEIGYLFGVKIFALDGKVSDLSNTVAVLSEEVPPPPRDVTVGAQADGIVIAWTADEEPAAGFRVYRRDAQSRNYGTALAALPGAFYTYTDRQAIYGARYIYGVTAVESTTPLLESDISSEHEVDYQDRFGPAVPGGLVGFPEARRVRLLWTPVSNPDLAGYEIRRRASLEEEPETLTDELVTRSQYLDEAVTTGENWFYSVVAIDQLGNRSEASAEVQIRVP